MCYYIVQGNKYRPGGSQMNLIHSLLIWKEQASSKRRNKSTTLPYVIN